MTICKWVLELTVDLRMTAQGTNLTFWRWAGVLGTDKKGGMTGLTFLGFESRQRDFLILYGALWGGQMVRSHHGHRRGSVDAEHRQCAHGIRNAIARGGEGPFLGVWSLMGIIRDWQGSRRGGEEGMGGERSLEAGEIAYVDAGRGDAWKAWCGWSVGGDVTCEAQTAGNNRLILSSHLFTCCPN